MEKVEINLSKLSGKASSKSESYQLLTAEGHLYLPPEKTCPIDFIAEIMQEKKLASNTEIYLVFYLWIGDGLKERSHQNGASRFWLENWKYSEILNWRVQQGEIFFKKIQTDGFDEGLALQLAYIKGFDCLLITLLILKILSRWLKTN